MISLTTITAVLFSVSIVLTYLWVRFNWVSISSALIVGFMFNSLTFFLFAIARDNGFTQAISVGMLQGLIFTVSAVSMGTFFRRTTNKDRVQAGHSLEYALESMSSDLKA